MISNRFSSFALAFYWWSYPISHLHLKEAPNFSLLLQWSIRLSKCEMRATIQVPGDCRLRKYQVEKTFRRFDSPNSAKNIRTLADLFIGLYRAFLRPSSLTLWLSSLQYTPISNLSSLKTPQCFSGSID